MSVCSILCSVWYFLPLDGIDDLFKKYLHYTGLRKQELL